MKKTLMAVLSAAVLALSFSAVNAQEVTQPSPDPASVLDNDRFQVGVLEWDNPESNETEQFFYYNGPITEKSSDVLEYAFMQYPDVKKIALSSPGGLASEAPELGNLFSSNSIETWVPRGRFCLSACANAFIGGYNYKVSGILGFHSAWVPDNVIAEMNPQQINLLFKSGQYQGVRDTHYWIVNGFSIQLPAVINSMTSPTSFLVFTNEDDLLKYYRRNDKDAAAEDLNQIERYFTFDSTIEPVVWGNEELGAELAEQYELLQTEGVAVRHIATIYDTVAETEEEG